MSPEPLMTPPEVASDLRCSAAWVRRLVREGKLLAIRNGDRGRIRVRRSDLEAYKLEAEVETRETRSRRPPPRQKVSTPAELLRRTFELASKRRRPKQTA